MMLLALWSCQSTTTNDEKTTPPPKEEKAPEKAPAAEAAEEASLLGVDVSHYQGEINWEELKGAKVKFSFNKATQGAEGTDPNFMTRQQGARAAGIPIGGYHFFVATDNSEAQANNFINTFGALQPGDLPPVLDLEEGGLNGVKNPEDYAKSALLWLQTIKTHYGVTPIVYVSPDFANEWCIGEAFGQYPLWVAQYGVEAPTLPSLWSKWTFWQKAETGTIPGINGNVDHDIFHGSEAELQNLVVK